jgi:hypothetical protein
LRGEDILVRRSPPLKQREAGGANKLEGFISGTGARREVTHLAPGSRFMFAVEV